jgi:hypothetical protein
MTGGSDIRSDAEDRSAILALLLGCFNASDRGDCQEKESFFVHDAVMRRGDDVSTEVRGLDALAASTRRVVANFITTHALSNVDVVVDDDAAQALTYAIVHVVLRHEPRVLVRGMRYDDHLVRTNAGWRITERSHSVLWQYEATTVAPETLLQYMPEV